MMTSPQLPHEAEIISRQQESPSIFSLELQLTDKKLADKYKFSPGQFNMLSLYGVGEIPISIVSDPAHHQYLTHTIRQIGRVSRGFSKLKIGDSVGLRGPFGQGWPLETAKGKDVMIITGGLGCAPVVSVINQIFRQRSLYGQLTILQGVKHSDDLIWRERYEQWSEDPNTTALLAADVASKDWPGIVGPVIKLIETVNFEPKNTLVMMCGPEVMMLAAALQVEKRGIDDSDIWLSMERNMQCANGFCGHCQIGPFFVCRDGPVFCYANVRKLLGVRGF